jgi:hypothetical protein
MKHFRFSIRGLMVVIVLLGIGFAALRYPTPFWTNVSRGIVRYLAATGPQSAGSERS